VALSGASVPVGRTALFGIFLDAAGNFSVAKGPDAVTADVAARIAAIHLPAPIAERAFIGWVRVANGSAAAFVPGTTALNAAGLTVAYVNAASTPAQPLRS
jgi:hypothetical protein